MNIEFPHSNVSMPKDHAVTDGTESFIESNKSQLHILSYDTYKTRGGKFSEIQYGQIQEAIKDFPSFPKRNELNSPSQSLFRSRSLQAEGAAKNLGIELNTSTEDLDPIIKLYMVLSGMPRLSPLGHIDTEQSHMKMNDQQLLKQAAWLLDRATPSAH